MVSEVLLKQTSKLRVTIRGDGTTKVGNLGAKSDVTEALRTFDELWNPADAVAKRRAVR